MLFNNFVKNYVKFTAYSSLTCGLLNNFSIMSKLNKIEDDNHHILNDYYNILDTTLEGMTIGFIFGITSPISLPLMAISTLNKVIRD